MIQALKMKKCKQGYYYCHTDKKCKRIPNGYRVGFGGYLRKENDTDDSDNGDNGKKNGSSNGNGNGNGGNGSGSGNGGSNGGNGGGGIGEGTLHKWFKGSKSKDGKGGWVNVVTGGTCASDEPGEGTPKCVSSAKRASMTKAERQSAARRKKAADPGQQQKSGAAKPTYVSTDKKKMKKEEVEIIEGKDKKGKGSGKKDACYHKVKSRYSVWPSAYASGALVKCRKAGAANWGNSTKKEEVELDERSRLDGPEERKKDLSNRYDPKGGGTNPFRKPIEPEIKKEDYDFSNWRDDFKAMEYEFIDLIKPEPLVSEASFEIGHTSADVRKAEKNEKIRKLAQQGSTEGERRAAERKAGTSLPSIKTEGKYSDSETYVRGTAPVRATYGGKTDSFTKETYKKKLKKEEVDKRRAPAELVSRLSAKREGHMAQDGPNKPAYDAKQRILAKIKARMKEEVETIDEAGKKCWKGYKKAGTQKLFGKTYNRCVKANEEFVDEAKDETEIGITGLPIPKKKRSPKKQYEFEKARRKNLGTNVGGKTYKKDVTPYYNPRVKEEVESDWRSEIEEGAAWTKKSGKNQSGGLNEKGRKSYERENPGSDLKRPSKKVGNPRRKSFCARMKGMKKKLTSSKTANDPDSRINKSLRAWNC